MNDKPIRILIVDDHTVVRKGLKMLLATPRLQISVVGEASNGQEAIERALELQPDIILMDLEMPQKSGIEATAEIKRQSPAARILVLTSFNDSARALAAIRAGAMGLLLKDSSPDDLVHAIRSLDRGQMVLPADLAQQIVQPTPVPKSTTADKPADLLTEREIAILTGLVQGLSNKEIAVRQSISPNTVRSHVRNILTKLGVSNRTQAALYAMSHNLIAD